MEVPSQLKDYAHSGHGDWVSPILAETRVAAVDRALGDWSWRSEKGMYEPVRTKVLMPNQAVG